MTEKRDYIAYADCWIAGRRVKAGDVLSMTEREAWYEPVQPVGVEETAAATAPADTARRTKSRTETGA